MASDKFIYNNTSEQETYSMESTQESSSLSVQTSVEGEQYSADIKVQNDALSVQASDAGNEYDFSAVAETDKLNVSESEEGDEYELDLTIYNDEMYLRGFLKSPSRYKFSLIIENDSFDVEQEENVAVGKRAYYTKEETLQLLSQKADWTASLAKYGIKDAYIEGRVIHLGGRSIAVPESGGSGGGGSSWLDDYLLPIYDDFGNVMGIQSIVGIASESFLSAKGLDDDSQMQGSFDEELMWQLLGTDIDTKIIADKHISANIARKSDITNLGSQYLTIAEFNSMFRRVTDGDKTYIKAMLGIATDSFLSAKGLDDDSAEEGGGFDEELMWIALGGSLTNKIVADQHLPANLVRTTRKVAGFSLGEDITVTNLSDALSLSRYLLRNEFADWQTQLTALRELFNTMFELVPATSEEPQYIRAKLGVASDSFLSAKGMDDDDTTGGSFDEDLMWMALGGSLANKIIADSHISSNIARASAFGNYYTKAEVAALIPNLSSYYTKEQTDRILTGYASIDFVNSSLSTATATFRGTFETVAALPTTNVNVNDYAFVIVEGEYRRYKYNGTSWVFEYTLNNSGYTAEQWSAVNSGITEDLVELIGINEGNIDLNARNIKTNADAIKTLTSRVSEFGESLTILEGLFDSDGKVQNAVNADLLEGHAASYFATKARVDALDTGIGTRIGDLETEIETIRKDYINSGELTNAINALGVPALKTRVQNLETAVGDLDEFVSDFEETGYVTIATHSSAISGLDTRIKANATAISNLSTDYEGFDERLDSAEANISTNATNITAQGKTIASHTTSINTLTSDVNGLKTSVSDLEELFDSDGKALKAVTADNASKLGGQLPSYYATASALTALTTRVSTAETNITNLTNNKLNKSVWDSVFEIDSNGNLKVKVGLYSAKFISSREADPNTGGGSGGAFSLYTWTQVKALTSEVGGIAPTAYALKQAYNEINTSLDGKASTSSVASLTTRVASLESKATSVSVSQTLTTGTEIGKITIDGVSKALYAPSSIAWGSVTGKPSFATVATSGKYSDLSGLPTIPSAVTESTVSGWGFTKNAGTITGIKMNGASKGTSGVVDLGTVITAHQSLTHLLDKTTAAATYQTIISATNKIAYANISGTPTSLPASDVYAWAKAATKPSYTAAEVGALPTSGGKTDSLTIVGSGTAWLPFGNSAGNSFGSLGINSSHEPKFWDGSSSNTLIHSGNVGDYKAGNSDKLGGRTLSAIIDDTYEDSFDLNEKYSATAIVSRFWAFAQSPNIANQPWGNSAANVWTLPGRYNLQIAKFYNTNNIQVRGRSGDGWTPWQQLAFTDSDITGNAASATKLQNARTIWGQSFDGTGDIPVTSIGTMRYLAFRNVNDNGNAGYVGRGSSGDNSIYLASYDNPLAVITNNGGIRINTNGNVTIGSSDLAGTSAKLYVDGKIETSGEIFLNNERSIRMKGNDDKYYNVLFKSGTDLHIGYDSPVIRFGNSKMLINSSGNVTIGSSDLAGTDYKLYVNGNVTASKFIGALEGKASSATKLATARTIWGQSFDGTGNVSGDIYVVQKNSNSTNYDSAVIRFNGIHSVLNLVQGPSIRSIFKGAYGRHRLAIYQHNSEDFTSEYEVFSILPNGNVGIGTTNPTEKLSVVGNITATTIYSATGVYSTGYVSARGADTSSDRRLKDNIAPIKNALNYVLGTNYVSFDWKDTREKSIGIIAQEEMGREWGCLVQKHSETYSYLYGQHTALLGAALQEEDKKVEELKAEIFRLKAEVKDLKTRLNS